MVWGWGKSTALLGSRCPLKETQPNLPPFFAGIFWGLKFKKEKKNIYIYLYLSIYLSIYLPISIFSRAWLVEFDLP